MVVVVVEVVVGVCGEEVVGVGFLNNYKSFTGKRKIKHFYRISAIKRSHEWGQIPE